MTKREQQLAKLLREMIDAWREFNLLMHASADATPTPETALELRMASTRFTAAIMVSDEFLKTGRIDKVPDIH
jgi:hypothetical protein